MAGLQRDFFKNNSCLDLIKLLYKNFSSVFFFFFFLLLLFLPLFSLIKHHSDQTSAHGLGDFIGVSSAVFMSQTLVFYIFQPEFVTLTYVLRGGKKKKKKRFHRREQKSYFMAMFERISHALVLAALRSIFPLRNDKTATLGNC